MASFVFVTGILFGFHFVAYPCEGKITIVNNTKYAVPGDNVTIEWKITNPISDLISRIWTFDTTEEPIANINDKGELIIRDSSLPGVKVKPPSTLILENVDNKYNGTYSFLIVATTKGDTSDTSYVTVIVAVKATVTINCSNPTIVDKDYNVRCLCKGEGGDPPAKVIWYDKNGGKIGVPGYEEKMLTLSNVDGAYNGTYKCLAQSYTLTSEKSIEVKVRPNFAPVITSFTSKPDQAVIGQSVTITCEARARPSPNYVIFHNGTEKYNGPEKTFTITNLEDSDTGLYLCIAKNKLGTSKPKYCFVTVKENAASNKSNDGTEWYTIVVSLLSGFIIGIFSSYIFMYIRRQLRNRKPQSCNPEPETSNDNSIYQDLDLSKMNSEDNYQSLRVDSGRNDADYENKNDST